MVERETNIRTNQNAVKKIACGNTAFSPSKRRWVHRFSEHFPPAGLTRLAAGPSLVALGSKDGKIHVYESSQGQF